MTGYEFETAAKNALVNVLKDEYGKEVSVEDLQFVWYSDVAGNKKCCLYASVMGNLYADVTYNKGAEIMFVSIYRKTTNRILQKEELDIVLHGNQNAQDVVDCT